MRKEISGLRTQVGCFCNLYAASCNDNLMACFSALSQHEEERKR